MSTRSFFVGFAIAGALGVAGAIWVGRSSEALPVQFGPKTFYDDRDDRAEDTGYVVAEGTLAGEDMNGSTFVHVECRHEQGTCRVADLSSLGGKRSVFLHTDEWPIRSWTREVIVVESQPPARACNRVQLVINRSTEVVQYNRIPQDTRDANLCKAFTNKLFKWTLEDQTTAQKVDI